MAGSAGTEGAETGAPPLSARVIGWHWRWPVLLASAAFVVLLGTVVGVYSVLGEHPILEGDHGVLGIGSHARMLIVLSFVLAYTLGAGLFGLAKAPRELDRLRPILRLGDQEWRAFRDRLFPNARALSIAASIGAPVGAGLDLLAYEARIESVREWLFDTSTLKRFALFLLIPLASWIGGALVERVVDAALG